MSMLMLGKQIDGIWHTGVEVYGLEYFFGGGGCVKMTSAEVEASHQMKPVEILHLGNTEIPQEVFDSFVDELSCSTYRGEHYDLIERNCNNFSDECAQFLLGQGIPRHIVDLPKEALSTPLGRSIIPMLQSIGATKSTEAIPTFAPKPSAPTAAASSSSTGSIDSFLSTLHSSSSSTPDQKKAYLTIVSKLLTNLLKEPSNVKFATITKSVSAIQKAFSPVPSSFDLLPLLGFKFDGAEKFIFSDIDGLIAQGSTLTNLKSNKAKIDAAIAKFDTPSAAYASAPSPAETPAAHPLMGLLSSMAGGANGGAVDPSAILSSLMTDSTARNRALNSVMNNPNLAGLSSLFGGAQNTPSAAAAVPRPAAPGREGFKSQIEAIKGMGFDDEAAIVAALQATGGDISAAMSYLCK